jgi:hypothetical protein
MKSVTVRDLLAAEAGWAAELMSQRREIYAGYSPVFWRPARNVTGLHADYLRRQIGSENFVSLRTDHGFLMAHSRPGKAFVDDFAIDRAGSWAADGASLLLAAAGRLAATPGREQTMLVVTAHADEAKVSMLLDLSLSLVEQWWVVPVTPAGEPGSPGRVEGPGFAGFLGPAPPVYDPGGLVLDADRAADDADPAVIEARAAELGAVLAVLRTPPGAQRIASLQVRGWTIASDWYFGWPSENR